MLVNVQQKCHVKGDFLDRKKNKIEYLRKKEYDRKRDIFVNTILLYTSPPHGVS